MLKFDSRPLRILLGLSLFALLTARYSNASPAHTVPRALLKNPPKLVLVIVVDQLRADYLTRFQKRLLPAKLSKGEVGGLEHFMSNGAYFPYGRYEVLQAMTAPGHATILTGAYPYLSGIPQNRWYDIVQKKEIYCVDDPKFAVVGSLMPPVDGAGLSPRNLQGSTLGDELKNAGLSSRVVTLALKDRAAILMGGHRADLALWMETEKDTVRWVSSRYYLPSGELPGWVRKLNEAFEKQKGSRVAFSQPEGPGTGRSLEDSLAIDSKWTKEFGKKFPHETKHGLPGSVSLPLGLTLTTDAAIAALDAYALGKQTDADVLAVSYSSFDYMGHTFGPNSREMEEYTVLLDREISRLLNAAQKHVPGGLDETLAVLTADHGVGPNPDWLKKNQIDATRGSEKHLVQELEKTLTTRFGAAGTGAKWVPYAHDGHYFFSRETLKKRKVELSRVMAAAREFLIAQNLYAQVITSDDVAAGRFPPARLGQQFRNTYFSGRSGDVFGVLRPFTIVSTATADHQTGYNYDAVVPIAFAGKHIRAAIFAQEAGVVDIAPTLSFILGVVPPAISEGRVLGEVFR